MRIVTMAAVLASFLVTLPPAALAADEPARVLVLGTFHMDNPGRDVNNFEADDVLGERRQREIDEVVSQLAGFRPTKICVEVPLFGEDEGEAKDRKHPRYTDRYAEYLKGEMPVQRDEVYQLAFRLAKRLGHERVYPVDADSPWGGFRFGAIRQAAREHGLMPILDAGQAETQALLAEFQEIQSSGTVGDILRAGNEPGTLVAMQRLYTDAFARVSAGEDYIGPDQVSNWFGRNLRIYANIDRIAEPGDRVLVIFGAGHAYYLRQFFTESARYELVDVGDVLRPSDPGPGQP